MNLSTAIIIFLCFFIFVIVVFLSLHDRLILIITRISGLYALLMGIFLYSMIYSVLAPDPFSGLLHTLLSVCWIFIGENGMDAAQEAAPSLPLFRDGIGFSLLWSAHLCGIFTTLSAAVNIIGKKLLVSLRKYLAMTKDLIVIYGVNSDSTLFAQELSLKENCSIIFVDEKPDADSLPTIYNFGGDVLDLETGKMSIDNEGFKQALQTLKDLYDAGYMTTNQKLKELRQSFANGELAMYYDQAWGFSGVSGINPNAIDYTASAAPMKGGSGSGQSVLSAGVFMVSNKNGNAEGVNKFIAYVTSDEVLGHYVQDIAAGWSAKTSQANMEVQAVLAGATGSQGNVKAVPMIEELGNLNLELDTLAQNITLNGMSVEDAIQAFKDSSAYGEIGE